MSKIFIGLMASSLCAKWFCLTEMIERLKKMAEVEINPNCLSCCQCLSKTKNNSFQKKFEGEFIEAALWTELHADIKFKRKLQSYFLIN